MCELTGGSGTEPQGAGSLSSPAWEGHRSKCFHSLHRIAWKDNSASGSYLSGTAGVGLQESFPFSAQGQRALLMTPTPESGLRGLTPTVGVF